MSTRWLRGAAVAALATLGLAAPASARTLEVVASFPIVADLALQVGGDRVHVVSLVPPNGDPHTFEPKPDDAKTLKAADVVVLSGLGLETWFTRLAKASGYTGEPVVASAGIKTRTMSEDGRTVTDPHAWTSAANAVVYAENIAAALAKADPEGAAAFKASAERYVATLRSLDADAHREIGAIPQGERKVLTTHDALGYFGAAYGIRFIAPLGLTTDKEPSAGQVARVIKQIKAEGIHTYFFENSSDHRLVKQIADATGAQPGGELYVESLSPAGGPAATYVEMFKWNVGKLVAGMKGARKS